MKHIVMRLGLIVVGLALIGHALNHLGIIPGWMPGPDGRTGWSGHSGLLDPFLSASVIWAVGDFTWFRCKITEIEYNQSER